MSKGWRNSNPKTKAIKTANLPPEVTRVCDKIRRELEESMRLDHADELYQYRVRYRYGSPKRIHYSERTKFLKRLLESTAKQEISPRYAMIELHRTHWSDF